MTRFNGMLLALLPFLGSGCLSNPPLRQSQVKLLERLGECVRSTKSHTGQQYSSACLSRSFDWNGLVGVSRSQLSKYVDGDEPRDADTFSCALTSISTSDNTLGGPLLVRLHFDQDGIVALVDFMAVQ
jgi:hypothetical protein